MKFKITECVANIGWKETDYGKTSSRIVEYDNLEQLLEGEEFYDEDWDDDIDEDEEVSRFHRILSTLENDGGFMCDDYDTVRYWDDPEPCDSYLTYGTYYTIEEVSDEEFAKIQKQKENKKSKNSDKWDKLFKDVNSLDELKEILKSYNFPSKYKD
jgi:hypothetical protein